MTEGLGVKKDIHGIPQKGWSEEGSEYKKTRLSFRVTRWGYGGNMVREWKTNGNSNSSIGTENI
jgi:hypothetical protein